MIGSKPLLQWVAVEELFIDESYQRSIETRRSQGNIDTIAKNFEWPLFQSLLISDRGGKYAVVDGQHRLMAAIKRGIPNVPCVIVKFASLADEVTAFIKANKMRLSMTAVAIYHASVKGGDKEAVRLDRLLAKHKVIIPRNPMTAAMMKPHETMAATTLLNLLDRHGEKIMDPSLAAITGAYKKESGLSASMIRAIVTMHVTYTHQIDPDILLATLQKIDPYVCALKAQNRGRDNKRSAAAEMLDAIVADYNIHATAAGLDRKRLVLAPRKEVLKPVIRHVAPKDSTWAPQAPAAKKNRIVSDEVGSNLKPIDTYKDPKTGVMVKKYPSRYSGGVDLDKM